MKISEVTTQTAQKILSDDRLFNKLSNDNKMFIYNIINKLPRTAIYDADEFFNLGLIGLWKALKSYSDDSISFSTYSYKCIYNEILMFIKNQNKKSDPLVSDDILYYMPTDDSVINDIINKEAFNSIVNKYITNDKDKYILSLLMTGMLVKDVIKESKTNHSYFYDGFRKKLIRIRSEYMKLCETN